MKTLFIGTGNQNKIKEIKEIFSNNNFDIEIKTPKDFNDTEEPIENGFSFKENAIIKAKYYYDKYKIPCLGEDSGITIDYLNGLPGIHSKRFLPDLNVCQTNDYIISLLKDVKNRKATFHAVICYIDEKGKINIFEGLNDGEIAFKQAGSEGFGYDPIFYIPSEGKTEAELGNEYKSLNGHRAKAFEKFINYIKTYEE